jgi:hypothetical protein
MEDRRVDTAPVDGPAVDFGEGDRLNLEAHVRLEAGLIDSLHATDPVSSAMTPPSRSPSRGLPTAWQTIKRFFGGSES